MTKTKAFSLVEVLVALAILGLSLSFFAYFADALKLTDSAKQEAEIAAFAYNYLENLRAAWQNIDNFETSYGLKPIAVPEGFEARVRIEEKRSQIKKKDLGLTNVVSLRTVTIILKDSSEKMADFIMSTQIARPVTVLNEK